MIGTTIKELCDYISQGHEAEFKYMDELYVLQSEVTDGEPYLVIWKCEQNSACICRYKIPNHDTITQDLIDKVLNERCFNGKSFYEIEAEITVENIF